MGLDNAFHWPFILNNVYYNGFRGYNYIKSNNKDLFLQDVFKGHFIFNRGLYSVGCYSSYIIFTI